MKRMNPRRVKSLFIGCLVTLFLSSLFLTLPLGEALALSMKEHTAKLVEGAKKEGKLVFYTAMTLSEAETLLKRFREKYPFIKTGVIRSGGTRLMSRIMAETRAKKYLFDVTKVGSVKDQILKQKGLTAQYRSPEMKLYPDVFKDREGYWTSIYVNMLTIGYNTNLVSPQEVPKAWEDLLDPKWKGRMGIVDNAEYWFINMLKIMGEEKGLEYMKKLAEQDLQWRAGRTLNTQLMAAGEFSIGVTLYNQRIEQLKTKGAPVDWVPFEPVIPELHPIAVSARAPHPNAAKLFVDFVLSKEGQEMIRSFYRIPCRKDVDALVPEIKCEGLKILPLDTASIVDDYDRYYKLYRKVLMKK
jgi:iron(III) transport system substrate-binding protein